MHMNMYCGGKNSVPKGLLNWFTNPPGSTGSTKPHNKVMGVIGVGVIYKQEGSMAYKAAAHPSTVVVGKQMLCPPALRLSFE